MARNTFARTLTDVKRQNKELGFRWFEKDTMKFFGTKIESRLYKDRYFITSEMPPFGERRYSIRAVNLEGKIETVGSFCAYATLAQARETVKELLMGIK